MSITNGTVPFRAGEQTVLLGRMYAVSFKGMGMGSTYLQIQYTRPGATRPTRLQDHTRHKYNPYRAKTKADDACQDPPSPRAANGRLLLGPKRLAPSGPTQGDSSLPAPITTPYADNGGKDGNDGNDGNDSGNRDTRCSLFPRLLRCASSSPHRRRRRLLILFSSSSSSTSTSSSSSSSSSRHHQHPRRRISRCHDPVHAYIFIRSLPLSRACRLSSSCPPRRQLGCAILALLRSSSSSSLPLSLSPFANNSTNPSIDPSIHRFIRLQSHCPSPLPREQNHTTPPVSICLNQSTLHRYNT
ncbi:hypothetical protein GX51_02401 [Blastomyces parvus]|uniref:Uncharacterized protein n=1 Tax=Blastomyces parvus TaxID=2060905 RepID=A0A2B7XBX4_9EURO|nr:hypothetical protein GX51_02401 [Blastomyces parvus]